MSSKVNCFKPKAWAAMARLDSEQALQYELDATNSPSGCQMRRQYRQRGGFAVRFSDFLLMADHIHNRGDLSRATVYTYSIKLRHCVRKCGGRGGRNGGSGSHMDRIDEDGPFTLRYSVARKLSRILARMAFGAESAMR